MSTQTVLSKIADSSEVQDSFIAATETRHRVVASVMMKTVKLLNEAVELHRQLLSKIRAHVVDAETSITTYLTQLLTSLGKMMREHIADSYSLINILSDVYTKHVNYLVTGISHQLQDCESLTAEVHAITLRAQWNVISNTEKEQIQLLREELEHLVMTFIDFDSMLDKAARNSKHQWHYFPNRLLIGDCARIFQDANKTLHYAMTWLDTFIPSITGIVDVIDDIVFTNMTDLRNYTALLSQCLTSYKDDMYSFKDQLNALSSLSAFKTDFSYEPPMTTLAKFKLGGEWLNRTTSQYISNITSKKQLAEIFAGKSTTMVVSVANRLYSDMELSLFTKLNDLIDQQETGMVSLYGDLLQGIASLQRYMFVNDTKLEQSMRRLSIWRFPVFNDQASEVF